MRIVQINETCGIGSTGRTTAEMAEYLLQNGHQAFVFFASGKASIKGSMHIGSSVDHKLHALLSRISGQQGYFSVGSTLGLLRQMYKIKPDVVHLRNLHGNYINLGILLRFLKMNNIPTVITLHDCWFMTGKCTSYITANCNKWKICCGKCPLLHVDNVNPTWFFDRTAKCYLDKKRWFESIPKLAVVGVSQWITNEAKLSIFKNRNPITIYNWIDTSTFYPRTTEVVKRKYNLNGFFIVLMVTSRITNDKGYQILLGMSKSLDDKCRLVLVGNNKKKVPIPSNVVHIPYTDDSHDLAALYSAADVCINTTKYETFGKVTAEALCCGTPVVVYNNTASPELVGPNCGYVVEESAGMEAVMQAVQKVREKGKVAYTNSCISFANEQFCMKDACEQYLALYKSMLEK